MSMAAMLSDIRALTFDVFGTVVDWRSGVAREARALLAPKGIDLDWGAFADAWRARYAPAMAEVREGRRPWTVLDDLHRENLVGLLDERGVGGLTDDEIDGLTLAWHRLDPWPDVLDGLARLKRRYVIATLSNGNVALTVNMARRAGLPWDAILGAEIAQAYKPAPQAYDRAVALLRLKPGQVLMTAAHTYDLDAAATRGLRTAYVHRPLEFGAASVDRPWPPAGTYDLEVDSFTALADALGC